MEAQIFLVQTQDIKQIFGLFNVKNAVRHFRFSTVKQKLPKLGTGGLTMPEYIEREAVIDEIEGAKMDGKEVE